MVYFDIVDKVALISGGASGIGFQYALALLEKGARGVTLADIDPEVGVKAVKEIAEKYGQNRAVFVKTDISNYNQFEDAFKVTLETFKNIDILINNAAIFADDEWEREITVNVVGTTNGIILGLEHYIPKYKSGPEGVIVNISSVSGVYGYPPIPVYTGTKFAVHGMTLSWGHPDHYERTKVKVIAVGPGATLTPMILDTPNKTLGPIYEEMREKQFWTDKRDQTPEELAAHVMKIIEKAETGSMWIVEGNEPPYRYDMPDRFTIPKILL